MLLDSLGTCAYRDGDAPPAAVPAGGLTMTACGPPVQGLRELSIAPSPPVARRAASSTVMPPL